MKEFMMIFVGGDYETAQLSPEEMQGRLEKWNAWVTELQNEDLYIEGKALQNASKRISGVDQVATDGPFVETKELVTGYFLFKANDMDHATKLTSKFPDYDLGGQVEIREIAQF